MKLKITLLLSLMCLSGWSLMAQVTKSLTEIFPMNLLDQRENLVIGVMGIGSAVHVDIDGGIKYLDACDNTVSNGELHIKIDWYNSNDEVGQILLQTISDLNVIQKDKSEFLEQEKGEIFAKGELVITHTTKKCLNAITGYTGETEYETKARFFAFFDNKKIKIELSNKMKPEKTKEVISAIIDKIIDFDFSNYSDTITQETYK